MLQQVRRARLALEDLMATEIQRLIGNADVCVFTLYDAAGKAADPLDFRTYRRAQGQRPLAVDVRFDYDGIGIWHICTQEGEHLRLRYIVVEISGGRFVGGQVGNFDGYWDDFPELVADDRWVRQYRRQRIAND